MAAPTHPTVGCAIEGQIHQSQEWQAKKISALVGVAPLNRDSGQMQGKRTLYGGRAPVRQMLYIATLVAVRHNPVICSFYEQLLERGKSTKVALAACMHKLLTILNAMIKYGTDWQPPVPSTSQSVV